MRNFLIFVIALLLINPLHSQNGDEFFMSYLEQEAEWIGGCQATFDASTMILIAKEESILAKKQKVAPEDHERWLKHIAVMNANIVVFDAYLSKKAIKSATMSTVKDLMAVKSNAYQFQLTRYREAIRKGGDLEGALLPAIRKCVAWYKDTKAEISV